MRFFQHDWPRPGRKALLHPAFRAAELGRGASADSGREILRPPRAASDRQDLGPC